MEGSPFSVYHSAGSVRAINLVYTLYLIYTIYSFDSKFSRTDE